MVTPLHATGNTKFKMYTGQVQNFKLEYSQFVRV